MIGVANSYKTSSELVKVANELIAYLAQKQGKTLPDGKPVEFNEVMLSYVILHSIDIEILLKAIYLSDYDQSVTGHNWKEPFDKLTATSQTEIISKMNATYQADFTNLLEKNSNTFIEWRYSYEAKSLSCDLSFVQNFANVLAEVARSRC